jgi:hypothetical protein
LLSEDDPHLERLPGIFEEVKMLVQENHKFSLLDEEAWSPNLFGANGFVRMGKKGRSFMVSFYHQFHCVDYLRGSYIMARDGIATDPEVIDGDIGHDNHCFQFLRESIMCKADNTLVAWNSPNQTLSRAGLGKIHRCRNWEHVRRSLINNGDAWEGIPPLIEGKVLKGKQ